MKKTRKTKLFHKLTSLSLMTFLLLQPVLALTVQAEDTAEATETEEPYVYTIPTEIISDESIEENGHIGRFAAGEREMNEICLLNDDGTNTMYIFDTPVKYVDDNGVVKDKSNKLHASKRNNYLYVNEENDVKTYFPKKITKKPVITEVGGYSIEIGIVTDSKYSKKGELLENNYVFYDKAFGDNTAIGYKPDFNGYKEEIILYSEEAPTSYSFEIYCYGLEVSKEGGVLVFTDEFSQCVVLTTDPFYIYDSSEIERSYIDTDYTLVKTDDYRYLMTIELDEEYIDSGLTYPVYIDPTLKYETQSSIEDAPVYTNRWYENFGGAAVCYLGYYNEDYGVGRMLIRCTELAYSDFFETFADPESKNVLLGVRLNLHISPLGTAPATIGVYESYGWDGWGEYSASWSNSGDIGDGPLLSSGVFSATTAGSYSFDITSAALHWIGDDMVSYGYIARGLMIKNENEEESSHVKMISTKNSSAVNSPYLTITYTHKVEDGTYYIQNVKTDLFADIESVDATQGVPLDLRKFSIASRGKWVIAKENNGFYTIKNLLTGLYMAVNNNSAANNASIIEVTDKSLEGAQWTFHLSSSGNIVISARSSSTLGGVLAVPNIGALIGTDLIQFSYTDDDNYKDEWALYRADNVYGVLPYWHSDREKVGYWPKDNLTYYVDISNTPDFSLLEGMVASAFETWEEVIGFLPISVDNKDDADIVIYGATSAKMYNLFNDESLSGKTIVYSSVEGFGIHSSTRTLKTIEYISSPIGKNIDVYILYNANNLIFLQNTVTHEIGHALGWFDHYPTDGYVMYKERRTVSTLSDDEKNHLSQVYDLLN